MVAFIAYDIPWVRVGDVLDLFSFPVPSFPCPVILSASSGNLACRYHS